MIIGVRGTTVWSEDLNRLLPFYRDRLGLPVAIDTPGFVVLGRSDAHALALGTPVTCMARTRLRRLTWSGSSATTSGRTGSG
jgi:catechol-2,3-dioxygenase